MSLCQHPVVENKRPGRECRTQQKGPEPGKHIITRAIGPQTSTVGDIAYDQQKTADLYLMCSDGLTEVLEDAEIVHTISCNQDVSVMADELIRAAKEAGGKDDISVVICKLLK